MNPLPLKFDGLTDAELLGLVGERQDGAFDEFFSRHAGSVLRLACAALPRKQDAEDVVQNVFLAAHRHARSFRGEASVRTWLLRITRNEAVRLRAKERRRQTDVSLDELGAAAGWGTPTPEALAISSENSIALRTAIDSLCPDSKEILVLRDLEGLTGAEAATVLGISLAAMKSRLHRARLELKRELKRELKAERRGAD